jgi:hydrogenase maturation protein HypF
MVQGRSRTEKGGRTGNTVSRGFPFPNGKVPVSSREMCATPSQHSYLPERRAITVTGIVQGVGFRPYVFRLAQRLELAGFVRNQSGSVFMEVEGPRPRLEEFLEDLRRFVPPTARIEAVRWRLLPALNEERFEIVESTVSGPESISVSPDLATCSECLAELFEPANRRYRYPFLNCTQCGPRLTIVQDAPYDRKRTTMAGFAMCSECLAEFHDPQNRRFHAQPNACPRCGPRLALWKSDGTRLESTDPLAAAVNAIRSGKIIALKGLGGYHLACDAGNDAAVCELRRRKHRDEKPFAVMVRDLAAAERLCHVDDQERELLESPRRPIVLLRKRRSFTALEASPAVAPGRSQWGLMLPYTPLHHLLLADLDGLPVVMTSGNRSDEPIVYEDDDAFVRLSGIADLFVTHDRPIAVRCEDSVTRIVNGEELPVRRSRGSAPLPISLGEACPLPLLAVGGQFKAVFALAEHHRAVLSHHLGDLDQKDAWEAFVRDVKRYERLFDIEPACLVHDAHPDYASTRYVQDRAQTEGLATLAVQHHHAHFASCLAEYHWQTPAIGVVFDGTGWGVDGAIWGGEFLVGHAASVVRAAHLRSVPMPGGDQAVREPWRMALAHLIDASCDSEWRPSAVSPSKLRVIRRMIEQMLHSPPTSSVGRLFDAVAAILGVCERVSYEGQAAMRLENLAEDCDDSTCYPFVIEPDRGDSDMVDGPLRASLTGWQPAPQCDVIDTRPLVAALAKDLQEKTAASIIARRFHNTLAELIDAVCRQIRDRTGLSTVALSGGVFQNALLTRLACDRLRVGGFHLLCHHIVPPNDGGLSLGQIAVAAAHWKGGPHVPGHPR